MGVSTPYVQHGRVSRLGATCPVTTIPECGWWAGNRNRLAQVQFGASEEAVERIPLEPLEVPDLSRRELTDSVKQR